MRYLSVCSGIEAASVAWHHLGWTPVAFSEIEPFPAAVLKHRFPDVPNYGDMTKHKEWPLEPGSIDLLVGGTPCQSFSVAGLRKGLSDPRGGLMLTYLEIAQRLRPRWIVWENVPGVLSSGGGRDLGAFLGALGELGYGWAYRVLDAQWVRTQRHPRAVPQRRRRVFVVGCLGDWERAAAVLFERESVQRDSAPRRAQGEGSAADAEAGARAGLHETVGALCADTHPGAYSGQDAYTGRLIPQPVAATLGNRGLRSHTELDGHGAYIPVQQPVVSIQGAATRINPSSGPDGIGVSQLGVAYTLEARSEVQAVAQPVPFTKAKRAQSTTDDQRTCVAMVGTDLYNGAITGDVAATMGTPGSSVNASGPTVMAFHPTQDPISSSESSHALGTGSKGGCATAAVAFNGYQRNEQQVSWPIGASDGRKVEVGVRQTMTVRRLTPRECERLQGFPDDWTLIPWRGKPADQCPDGPRYKALGNSMAVNCMAWIGERIAAAEASHA